MRDKPSGAWTCPFCPLLCDSFAAHADGGQIRLAGSECPRAIAALAHFSGAPTSGVPQVDGEASGLDAALDAAAGLLALSRQPLFGGLATDVAGARALYRLACATGAISDAAAGAALMHGLRALQDRGAFTTTLAEVRTRADVIVCIGGSPTPRLPEFFRRCGIGEDLVEAREVVGLGGEIEPGLAAQPRTTIASIAPGADLHGLVAMLAGLVAGQTIATAPEALRGLAERLLAARYAVLVWDAATLPRHGALLAEALNRVVASLNRRTRAGALPLGGGDGASTVNQVYAWLSGLPLRSRAGPLGLEHEPLTFDATRLLAEGAADSLLWVSSFGPEPAAPAASVPTIVLGHPAAAVPAGTRVFIPVSTPGLGSAGHLFRNDGVVLMPLPALYDDTLPTVASVAAGLLTRVAALQAAAGAPA